MRPVQYCALFCSDCADKRKMCEEIRRVQFNTIMLIDLIRQRVRVRNERKQSVKREERERESTGCVSVA